MSYKYYIKKCGYQELGSVVNNKVNRGRYFLISSNPEVQDIFPHLSTTRLNDSALIPIIPLNTGDKVYCTYKYNNDLFHNSTAAHPRNEKRLYLNKNLEQNELLFKKDDIIIIRKELFEIENSDNDTEAIYYLMHLTDKNDNLYNFLNRIIATSDIRGGHAIYFGNIEEFEQKVFTDASHSNNRRIKIDEKVTKELKHSKCIHELFTARSFRDFVMVGYNTRCAITNTVIEFESYTNLEAAHIKPKSHGGYFLPENGIAMCRDIHWAFDKGFFTINDDYTILVHDKVKSEYLRSFNGKLMNIPENTFFRPSLDSLNYHRLHIYGSFLK